MKKENDLYHTPAIYRGKSYVTRECITGKLSFWTAKKHAPQIDATIAVLSSATESAYLASGDDASTVAAVFIGDHPSESLCAYACVRELPLLILSHLDPIHDGKITILDSRNATLFVDPDLDTLERYARHLRLSTDHGLLSLLSALCTCHCAVPIQKNAPSSLFSNAKMLVTDSNTRTEDEWFERLRELAETAVGTPLILCIRIYDLHSERVRSALQARLRALLRAAVYGSFSLLLEGLCCAEQAKQTVSLCDAVSEELAKEGREHDPHLPRGIAVESFLLLHELSACPSFDYLCLNGDRLWQSALTPCQSKNAPPEITRAFADMLRNHTHALTAPIFLKTDLPPASCQWVPAIKALDSHTLFVPEKHVAEWYEAEA